MSTMTRAVSSEAHAVDRNSTQYLRPSSAFRENFNRLPFLFEHHLANHPLFSMPRLRQLALETRKNRPQELYHDAGKQVNIGQKWSQMGIAPPLEEAFDRIENAGAWISIHQVQEDPEYADLFFGCMREFESQSGADFKKLMRVEDALIFITSPKRTTTYHIDRECNFLMQISGSKSIYVFDRDDRAVLPEQEIERFWTVDNNAPVYKPELQERSTEYRLIPGNGIHLPINDPHWLQNDDNISVSLSVNFTMKDSERANVYRANHLLRRFGINPQPPFQSPVKDAVKNAVMTATYLPARRTARYIRELRGKKTRTM